jgi:hypothetical protein
MSDFRFLDLFQWDRFITPSLIRVFYWLAVVVIVLTGLWGIASGLLILPLEPIGGLFMVVMSMIGTFTAVVLARMVAEFVLITFRIEQHLGAIRRTDDRGRTTDETWNKR